MLVIGEDFLDCAFRQINKLWVRLAVVRDNHGRLVECVAARSVPRAGVDVEGYRETFFADMSISVT